jgi:hypothetical protein
LDFSLTDEQRLFQDELDKSLEGVSSLARVRAQAEQPNDFPEDIWQVSATWALPGRWFRRNSGASASALSMPR